MLNTVLVLEAKVIAGGRIDPSTPAIWTYENGRWSQASVPRAEGQVLGMTIVDDLLVAVGHELQPGASTAFVWTSRDGAAWAEAEVINGAALYDVVVAGDTIVAVGDRVNADDEPIATSWTSKDADTWTRGRDAETVRSSLHVAVPFGSTVLAAGLHGKPARAPIWRTTDNARWTAVRNNLTADVVPLAIAVAAGRPVIGAGIGPPGQKRPYVAVSTDGVTYRGANLSKQLGYVGALTVADGTAVAAGIDDDRLIVWRESGTRWAAQEIERTGAAINDLAWTSRYGLIGVGTRDGKIAVWSIPHDGGG